MVNGYDIQLVRQFEAIWANAGRAERKMIREIVDGTNVPKTRQDKAAAERILCFLNEKAGRQYRNVDVNIKPIMQRLQSGITEEQLRAVIAKKCREWRGTSMESYLRPATLFGREKVEQYVGELGA